MNRKILKRLAKSDKWQIVYDKSKKLGSLRLFNNTSDLSKVQIYFLHLLGIYDILFTDLFMKKDYMDESILNDELRIEAYLLLRQELNNPKNSKENKKNKQRSKEVPSMLFKRK